MAKKKELTEEERLEQALVPESEWPYELPEGWKWVRLEGLCNEIQYGYTAKAENNESFPKLLRITDLKKDGVNWSSVPNCNINEENFIKYKIKEGDIFFARTGATTGKSYLVRNVPRAVFASYLIRLQVNRMILNDYLYNFLQSGLYWNQISDLSSGIAQPGVNSKKLREIIIPLAPIEKQQQIVDQIESLFSKLEEAKEKVESVLESSENRKFAILHKAFTGELTKKWREENGDILASSESIIDPEDLLDKDQEPYEIPDSWSWSTLGNMTKVIGGGTPSSKVQEYYEGGTIPWIRPADLSGYKNVYISRGERNITTLGSEKSSARKLPKDTVLLSSRAPIGYVVIAGNELTTNQGFKSFLPRENYMPKYLYWYLKGNKPLLEKNASGTTFLELSASRVGQIEIPLPTVIEQKQITYALDKIMKYEKQLKDNCLSFLEDITTIKKSVLSNIFRGN